MKKTNQNDDISKEIKELKFLRNIHFSGEFMGSILTGYNFAVAIKGDQPIFYSVLGMSMAGYTIYHTLKTSEAITEIKNVQQKINKKKH